MCMKGQVHKDLVHVVLNFTKLIALLDYECSIQVYQWEKLRTPALTENSV